MKNSLSYSSHTHLKLLCIYTAMMVIKDRKKNKKKIITQNQHYYYRKTQKNIYLFFLFMKHTILLLHSSFVINQRGWRSPTRHTLLFFSYSIFSCYYILRSTVCLLTLNHTMFLLDEIKCMTVNVNGRRKPRKKHKKRRTQPI